MNPYPRPVRDIHQLELTTECNLRCHYCPSPNLPRTKEHMSRATFAQALRLVEHYVKQNTQTELSLTGIGESLLHPDFIDMVKEARAVIGSARPLVVTTNGLLLDEDMCRALQPYNPRIFVSLHRPEKAAFAIENAKKYGLLQGYNNSFATSSFDWAGYQKNWTPIRSAPRTPCEYLRSGWGVVLVDGRIATCCLDVDASSTIGTVWDDPKTLLLKPWENEKTGAGCKACHMYPP